MAAVERRGWSGRGTQRDHPGAARSLLLDGGLASELELAGCDLDDPLWSARALLTAPEAVEAAHLAFLRAGADVIITATYQATFEGFAARGIQRDRAEALLRRAVRIAMRARDRFLREGLDSEDLGSEGLGGGAGTGASWRARRRDAGGIRHGAATGSGGSGSGDSGSGGSGSGDSSFGKPPSRNDFGSGLHPLVAASVGPYGAFLADGSEYLGDYGIGPAALARFHADRLRLLAAAGADLLACETIPSFVEAGVLAGLVAALPNAPPAWFTFTCRDEAHISDGTPIATVAAWAERTAAVSAVGVNCTPAARVTPVVRALAAGTRKPVIAYPNGGGDWDAAAKRWSEAGAATDWGAACREWVAAGAVGVGGCCRVGPGAIRAMRAALDGESLPARS